jgi:hypothetical protein
MRLEPETPENTQNQRKMPTTLKQWEIVEDGELHSCQLLCVCRIRDHQIPAWDGTAEGRSSDSLIETTKALLIS